MNNKDYERAFKIGYSDGIKDVYTHKPHEKHTSGAEWDGYFDGWETGNEDVEIGFRSNPSKAEARQEARLYRERGSRARVMPTASGHSVFKGGKRKARSKGKKNPRKSLEELRFTPEITFAIVISFDTKAGNKSKKTSWVKGKIRQYHVDNYYYYGRDTIGQNPLIHFKKHWATHKDYYLKKINKILEDGIGLLKRDKKGLERRYKNFKMVWQRFDAQAGRKVIYSFPKAYLYSKKDVESIYKYYLNSRSPKILSAMVNHYFISTL